MGGFAAAVVLLFFISVRALDRSHFATKHTSSNPLQQLELKWTEKGENSRGLSGLPVTEEKSRLFRSQLPLEPGAPSLDSLATLSTPGLLGIQTDSFTAPGVAPKAPSPWMVSRGPTSYPAFSPDQ